MAINNTVTNKGLMPLSNFGTPSTAGTTTPSIQYQTPNFTNVGGYANVNIPTGTSSTVSKAPTPNFAFSTPPKTNQGLVQTQSSGTDYTLHPGESIDAYNKRVNTSGNIAAATNNSNASLGGVNLGTPIDVGNAGNNPQNPQNLNPYTAQAPTYPGLVGSLASTASQPSQQYLDAQKQYLGANEQLQKLQSDAAQQNANIGGSRTNLAEAGGERGLLQNLVANKESALTGEMNAAQSAAQVATGQQGTQQTGLNEAGQLGAPQQAGPTNVPFNPLTGQYGTPAAGAYDANGGSNPLQSIGNISGQIGVGEKNAQLNSVLGGAQVVGRNLQGLITKNNINPSDATFLNAMNQYLQTGVLSNPQYQEFTGQVNELINSLAPILGAGGSATDMKTQMASQILNAKASGKSMNDVIGYFLDQAKQKLQGQLQGGGVNTGAQSSGGTGLTFGSFFGS